MKKLIKSIQKAESSRIKYESDCSSALIELVKHFDFPCPSVECGVDNTTYFHIEHQPSDGMVLGDNDSFVYALSMIVSYIQKNGNIKSFYELKQFSI